jgi:hypothetical protein
MLLLPVEATAMRPSTEFSLIGTLYLTLTETTAQGVITGCLHYHSPTSAALFVRTLACSRYAAESLLAAVHLRLGQGSSRARPGHGPCDAVVRDVQRRGPPGYQVLRAAPRGRNPCGLARSPEGGPTATEVADEHQDVQQQVQQPHRPGWIPMTLIRSSDRPE